MRVALGVTRTRLIGLVMTEAAVLAAAGTIAALIVARWSGAAARSFLPDIVFTSSSGGARLLAFSIAAAVVTVLLAGLMPALQAAGTSPTEAFRSSSRGSTSTRSRLRHTLMIGQTALSVVLLVGAGLFVRSFSRAAHANVGFDHERVVVAVIEEQRGVARARVEELYQTALARAASLPGVQRAALSIEATIAFGGYSGPGGLKVPGSDKVIDDLPDGGPFLYSGTEGFFETLGVPILKGQSFTAADYADTAEPVGMVSDTFARTVWPGRNPIGQCFQMGASYPDGPAQPCRRVIGALIRQMLVGLSPDVRFASVTWLATRYDALLEPWKLGATMFLVFGALALGVAIVGLYGMLAFGVAQRRRELGIRSGLGAERGDLIAMVLRQSAGFVATGSIAGSLIALAAGRFVEGLLFDVHATDPLVYALVMIVLSAAALVASVGPAWRAAAVNPSSALQVE